MCKMLTLYAVSVTAGELVSQDAINFQFWLLIELIVLMATVVVTILHLLQRSIISEAITKLISYMKNERMKILLDINQQHSLHRFWDKVQKVFFAELKSNKK